MIRVYVESWEPTYSPPYQISDGPEEPEGRGVPVEDGGELRAHPGGGTPPPVRLAFVDGVRRGEAWLYRDDPDRDTAARGLAGAFACGAAVIPADGPPAFERTEVQRLVIWGSGADGTLPDAAGGFRWRPASIDDPDPEAPLRALQARMRQRETELAEELAADGHLTVVDGPLTYVRSRDLPVIGYVKTHHRPLLAPDLHRRIPELLGAGERTSLFTAGEDRYAAYLRLAPRDGVASPWSGIVRIEIPQSAGLAEAAALADRATALLPRFAGLPHRDPRAPQNLQPIGALERHLRRLLGNPRLAARAVREAVASIAA